jgi:hypothetical protein
MPQKHIFLVMQAALGSQKTFYFLTFLGWKFSKTHQFIREMLKYQVHLCKIQNSLQKTFNTM